MRGKFRKMKINKMDDIYRIKITDSKKKLSTKAMFKITDIIEKDIGNHKGIMITLQNTGDKRNG